ncbi:MAG TPA: succinate dehydrogenase assembly factor 2 [Gammaproteobacteria bacterium]|jgi:antitoxin CptB|nr:succinate dehydrogenase assembly factor 2 [Gammaproteobacteria bacterium]
MSEVLPVGKLRWRCRRGVRELDVLLTRFLDQTYDTLSNSQKLAFCSLLEVQDPIIMDWIFARSSSDEEDVQDIVKQLAKLVD